VLENGQISRAFAVHVHDAVLHGEAVGNLRHLAQQDRRVSHHFNGNGLEPLHRFRAGIQEHAIVGAPDSRLSRGQNHVRGLERGHHVTRRKPLGRQRLRVDVHNNLPFLAAEGRGGGQTGNSEQADTNKIQAVVVELLLGNGVTGNRELRYRNIGGVELNDVGRRHTRGRNAQDGV
jgi:hypothetical protein